ncbi:MAG TPA: tRNA lysidine(34) synthetase TilS [Steroidobacteraceae bacterium]
MRRRSRRLASSPKIHRKPQAGDAPRPQGRGASGARGTFSPQRLADRLAALVPKYPDVSLCVAFSGGVDSSVLLAALAGLRAVGPGGPRGTARPSGDVRPRLRAVHVNHGIHPNAGKWVSHCRGFARRLGVTITVLTTKVVRSKGVSLEAAAREARYSLLAEHLERDEVLLTGHHEDDQLETVLLQLFRGSGLAGLAAMPELTRFATGQLARPLLPWSREQLAAWAQSKDLSWIEDDTNEDQSLDRNYLRGTVLPLVRNRWSGVGSAVARSARHAADGQKLLDEIARRDVARAADGASLNVGALRSLTSDRRRNALRFWIARSGHKLPDTRRLEEISGALLDARPDAKPHASWGEVSAHRDGGLLTLRPRARRATPALGETVWDWREAPRCILPSGQGTLEVIPDSSGPVDLALLPSPLTVRSRRGGERLRLHRGGPSRTLKNLLQEAHVPVTERAALPLLFAGAQLIAAADRWIDASVQVTPGPRRRGRILWRRPK